MIPQRGLYILYLGYSREQKGVSCMGWYDPCHCVGAHIWPVKVVTRICPYMATVPLCNLGRLCGAAWLREQGLHLRMVFSSQPPWDCHMWMPWFLCVWVTLSKERTRWIRPDLTVAGHMRAASLSLLGLPIPFLLMWLCFRCVDAKWLGPALVSPKRATTSLSNPCIRTPTRVVM